MSEHGDLIRQATLQRKLTLIYVSTSRQLADHTDQAYFCHDQPDDIP